MKPLSEEVKAKNAVIARLREQLEHKMKKVLEMRAALRAERDETH